MDGNNTNVVHRFYGAWTLVSWIARSHDGIVSYPYGEDPVGLIVYQPEGKMVACLMRRLRTPFASENRHQATSDECVASYREYVSYFGSFTVQEARGTVTHHVEGATFSNWIGTDLVRIFHFYDRILTLSLVAANGSVHQLTWERALHQSLDRPPNIGS